MPHGYLRLVRAKMKAFPSGFKTFKVLHSKFREAALQDCEDDGRVGIVTLADKLRKICFVQGISSDRTQTIVRSKNCNIFHEIVETALEKESTIFSKNES
jgi:hypothetical protein